MRLLPELDGSKSLTVYVLRLAVYGHAKQGACRGHTVATIWPQLRVILVICRYVFCLLRPYSGP